MKKQIFILMTLITFNVSYASFPVTMERVISIDTIMPDTNKIVIKETTSEFHSRMQKDGFDLANCMCEDCRSFKGVDVIREDRHSNSRTFLGRLGIGLLFGVIILVIVLFVTVTVAIGTWWDNMGY